MFIKYITERECMAENPQDRL